MAINYGLNNKTVLITGGTGSLGKACTRELLNNYKVKSLRIFSRDELKQWEMSNELANHPQFEKLRFFIGDVRDKDRLARAFEDVDIIIHAAALKQVPTAEYNPMECIKTNIIGAQNVIEAAIDHGVKKVVALSTDKAAEPINLYGATKLCSDKLFVAANNIRGNKDIIFTVVRYGNVLGSRGSVLPLFMEQRKTGALTITHPEMTRFNILTHEAVATILYALANGLGGEIFIPKLPSYRLTDLARAVAPKCKQVITHIRPGEKLHEEIITMSDSLNTIELNKYYVIVPSVAPGGSLWNVSKMIKHFRGKRVKPGFRYSSETNNRWLTVQDLRNLIKKHFDPNFTVEA